VIKPVLAVFALALVVTGTPSAHAEELAKEQIEAIVRAYILENPQVLVESLETFRITQEKATLRTQEVRLGEFNASVASDTSPSIGNADGDITIVEFFDYNCGYCRKALTEITRLVAEDDQVRIIFKEMPILGPPSLEAAKWALAARVQGADKYFSYHTALMNHSGSKDDATLERLAADSGLNVDQLKADRADASIMGDISDVLQVTSDIGVRGTPAFIINGELFRGYIPYAQMKEVIRTIRAQ